ncbi:MAG: DJ-1/PfpI family protein [Gemmatimonadaceae bacterium]
MRIGYLLVPQLTQLDLTGAYEVLARLPDAESLLVALTRDRVVSDTGLAFSPDATFADVSSLDVLVVPGGPGATDAMVDDATLDFVSRAGEGAAWVTSVCTGALVLGAAGLLRGYRATTHWASMDLLPYFGATPVHERVVIDRNRVTGGGVTAGIDFGLTLAAQLAGRAVAEAIQLNLEYVPAPPFSAGSPETAPADVVARYHAGRAALHQRRIEQSQAAARRLGVVRG